MFFFSAGQGYRSRKSRHIWPAGVLLSQNQECVFWWIVNLTPLKRPFCPWRSIGPRAFLRVGEVFPINANAASIFCEGIVSTGIFTGLITTVDLLLVTLWPRIHATKPSGYITTCRAWAFHLCSLWWHWATSSIIQEHECFSSLFWRTSGPNIGDVVAGHNEPQSFLFRIGFQFPEKNSWKDFMLYSFGKTEYISFFVLVFRLL